MTDKAATPDVTSAKAKTTPGAAPPNNPPCDGHDHHDRCQHVPMVWRCRNVACSEEGSALLGWDFVSDEPKCPKCGATPTSTPGITLRSLIHLLIPDPHGKIAGQYCKWSFACDPKREHLATVTNCEAASDNVQAVNCPACLKVAHAKKITQPLGTQLAAQAFLKG